MSKLLMKITAVFAVVLVNGHLIALQAVDDGGFLDARQTRENDNKFLEQAVMAVPEFEKLNNKSADTVFQQVPRTIAPAVGMVEESEGEERKIESEEIKSTIIQQLPMAGQQILLGSEAIRQLYDKGIEGPVALHKITMHMVEPAVAAGAQGAEVSTALLQSNLYQSQQLRWSEYMSDPDLYRHAMISFQGCMNKETTSLENGSWVKALQVCSGDAVFDKDIRYRSARAAKARVFSGKNHNSATSESESTVKISDMLFKEIEGGDEGRPFTKEDRQQWIDWFGDYELKIEPEDQQSDIYPKIEGTAMRVLPKKSVEKILDEMAVVSTKQIFKVLKKYCTDRNEGTGNSDGKLWIDSSGGMSVKDELRELSLPQLTFDMATINLMYKISENLVATKENSNKIDCDQIAYEKDSAGGTPKALLNAMFRNYGEMIAQGHLLNSWLVGEQFVARRTSGMSFDGQTREYAFRLIYDVAKTDNILGLVEENLNKLSIYRGLMLDHASLHYGSGGLINQQDVLQKGSE